MAVGESSASVRLASFGVARVISYPVARRALEMGRALAERQARNGIGRYSTDLYHLRFSAWVYHSAPVNQRWAPVFVWSLSRLSEPSGSRGAVQSVRYLGRYRGPYFVVISKRGEGSGLISLSLASRMISTTLKESWRRVQANLRTTLWVPASVRSVALVSPPGRIIPGRRKLNRLPENTWQDRWIWRAGPPSPWRLDWLRVSPRRAETSFPLLASAAGGRFDRACMALRLPLSERVVVGGRLAGDRSNSGTGNPQVRSLGPTRSLSLTVLGPVFPRLVRVPKASMAPDRLAETRMRRRTELVRTVGPRASILPVILQLLRSSRVETRGDARLSRSELSKNSRRRLTIGRRAWRAAGWVDAEFAPSVRARSRPIEKMPWPHHGRAAAEGVPSPNGSLPRSGRNLVFSLSFDQRPDRGGAPPWGLFTGSLGFAAVVRPRLVGQVSKRAMGSATLDRYTVRMHSSRAVGLPHDADLILGNELHGTLPDSIRPLHERILVSLRPQHLFANRDIRVLVASGVVIRNSPSRGLSSSGLTPASARGTKIHSTAQSPEVLLSALSTTRSSSHSVLAHRMTSKYDSKTSPLSKSDPKRLGNRWPRSALERRLDAPTWSPVPVRYPNGSTLIAKGEKLDRLTIASGQFDPIRDPPRRPVFGYGRMVRLSLNHPAVLMPTHAGSGSGSALATKRETVEAVHHGGAAVIRGSLRVPCFEPPVLTPALVPSRAGRKHSDKPQQIEKANSVPSGQSPRDTEAARPERHLHVPIDVRRLADTVHRLIADDIRREKQMRGW